MFFVFRRNTRLVGRTLPVRFSVYGIRRYTSKEEQEDAPENEDIFATVMSGPSESTSYPTWAKDMRAKLSVGTGPVYLGKKGPFPYNPDFQPVSPLSDEFKELVLKTWESDTTKWTPRQLSLKFKISIERVKAVIKLKLLQKKMEATGFQINRKFLRQMESHLGAKAPFTQEVDKLDINVTENMVPKLVAIPEEAKMSHNEAAALLGRTLRPIHQMIDADISGDVPFIPNRKVTSPEDHSTLVIQKDPYELSRWKFIFTDISADVKGNDREVLIREPDGILRKADSLERAQELALIKNK